MDIHGAVIQSFPPRKDRTSSGHDGDVGEQIGYVSPIPTWLPILMNGLGTALSVEPIHHSIKDLEPADFPVKGSHESVSCRLYVPFV